MTKPGHLPALLPFTVFRQATASNSYRIRNVADSRFVTMDYFLILHFVFCNYDKTNLLVIKRNK
jgi:hypothetical protein